MVIDNYEGKRILLCNIVIYLGLVVVFTCLLHLEYVCVCRFSCIHTVFFSLSCLESCFTATFREILLPSSGKVCECVCGIYVFTEDRNIILFYYRNISVLCEHINTTHTLTHLA